MKKKTDNTETIEAELPVPIAKIKEFQVDLVHIRKIVGEYSLLTVDGVKDHAGLKKLTSARQELKAIRIKVDKRRMELNSGLLNKMRSNNKAGKYIIGEFLPTELILRGREREIKNQKEEIRLEKKRAKMEKLQVRINALNKFEMPFELNAIEFLTDRQFAKLLAQAEIIFNERKVAKEQNAKKMAEETLKVINENIELKEKIKNTDLDLLSEFNSEINIPVENIPEPIEKAIEKYYWQKDENSDHFFIWHTENSINTKIAKTNDAEKADFLAKAANFFSKHYLKLDLK